MRLKKNSYQKLPVRYSQITQATILIIMFPLIGISIVLFLSLCKAIPFPADDALSTLSEVDKLTREHVALEISKVQVESTITKHYASTKYIIKVTNRAQFYQEGNYTIDFPKFEGAPVELIMQAGFTYDAKIKMIEEAKEIYNEGILKKKNRAILKKNQNERNSYLLLFNIEPHSESSFQVNFVQGHQENIKGYKFTYRIDPKQAPRSFALEVSIRGASPLKYTEVSPLHSEVTNSIQEFSRTNKTGETTALVKLELNETQLKQFFDNESNTQGKPIGFTVEYDVDEQELTVTGEALSKRTQLRRSNEFTLLLQELSDGTASISDQAYESVLRDITNFSLVTDISALVTNDARPVLVRNAYPYLGSDRSLLEYRLRSHCFPPNY